MACRLLGSISPQHDSSRKFPLVNSPADSPQQVPRCNSSERHSLQLHARRFTWQPLATGEKVELISCQLNTKINRTVLL
jgi:hypothetical protein